MVVNYYFISGCTYRNYDGNPCIFAPADTDEKLLQQYDFQQSEDGRYYKILTAKEREAVIKACPYYDVSFTYQNSQPMYHFSEQEQADESEPIFQDTAQDYPDYYDETSDRHSPESQDSSVGFILSAISLGCILFSVGILFLKFNVLLSGLFGCVGLILIISIRIRYPEDMLGKFVSGIGILLLIGAISMIFYIIIACNQMMEECCSCNIPG